jgi:alanine racemase
MSHQSRKTQALINIPALKQNYINMSAYASHSETIAVIKANAYGHGALTVAKHLDNLVPAIAVAFIDEAITLRNSGIKSPILVLEGALCPQDFSIANQHDFWLMFHNHEQIDWLQKHDSTYNGKFWLKVDTGMNRLGFMPNNVNDIINNLSDVQQKNLVLCTHFSNADETKNPKTSQQISSLFSLAKNYSCQLSLANSAGIINWQESHSDYNRLGIALYGANPMGKIKLPIELKPVMTLQSTVIALRDLKVGDCVGYGSTWQAKRPSSIATIAIGYADGYPRNAKLGTPVWVNGEIAPISGRVSMDMITIDVTDIDNVNIGDQVELWGENLSIETVAEYMDTINYELLTRISDRVPRKYIV